MVAQVDKKPVEKIQEKAREESAPAPVRRYRAVLFQVILILFATGFAVLTYLVKMTPVSAIDLQITRAVQLFDIPGFALLMEVVSWPGYGPQTLIITAAIVLAIYALGLHWEAVAATAAAIFSTSLDVLVKDLVQRPRPLADMVNVIAVLNSYSFPSGHVVFYLGFFGFIGFLAFSLLKPSVKRALILAVIGAFIVLIGISRIYLGQHWASDVLGAYLLGSLILVANIQFYRWGKARFFIQQPVAAAGSQKA